MNVLNDWWTRIWPNLAASLLWVPVTLIHITRSTRKGVKLYLGNQPGTDEKKGSIDV